MWGVYFPLTGLESPVFGLDEAAGTLFSEAFLSALGQVCVAHAAWGDRLMYGAPRLCSTSDYF